MNSQIETIVQVRFPDYPKRYSYIVAGVPLPQEGDKLLVADDWGDKKVEVVGFGQTLGSIGHELKYARRADSKVRVEMKDLEVMLGFHCSGEIPKGGTLGSVVQAEDNLLKAIGKER